MHRFNKITKKLDKLTRSPSPQRQLGHIPNIPDVSDKEMSNNAFEVIIENTNASHQNTHPLDEPLTLRNGKKIYPTTTTTTTAAASTSTDSAQVNDLLGVFHSVLKFIIDMVVKFWKLDMYFDVSLTEGSVYHVHVPTVVFTLIGMKIGWSFMSTNNETYVSKRINNESSGFNGIWIILLCCAVGYWMMSNSNSVPGKTPIVDSPPVVSHQRVDVRSGMSAKSDASDITLWDNDASIVYESDTTPPLTRVNSFQTQLENTLQKNKPYVEKVKIVHRQEERRKNPKLDINLPIELKKSDQVKFDDLTRQRRSELMHAFD